MAPAGRLCLSYCIAPFFCFAQALKLAVYKTSYARERAKIREIRRKGEKIFGDVNPIPVKTAMNLIGFDAGECRLPLVPMSVSGYHDLKDCLAKYDLLDKYANS